MTAPMLPANISIAKARLPETYQQAKQALVRCSTIDECKDWSDKAAALASYARQADDDELYMTARRIQGRAVRRCGELLEEFDGRGSHRKTEGTHSSSQRQAAAGAGMSEHQQVQAVRVAAVPPEQFEAAIEATRPATVTQLAEMGTRHRDVPDGFKEATHLLGAVRRFAEFCSANDAARVAGGLHPAEEAEVRDQITAINGWLERFVANLKGSS